MNKNKRYLRILFHIIVLIFPLNSALGQVRIENPSFEGQPQDATMPEGWQPCALGTTPDILPGFWGVYNEAEDGETYMGLITREDGSFESVTQRLSEPMKAGECYTFSLYLAHSKTYSGYNLPIKLNVWGSQRRCSNDELLGETKHVAHEDWQKYEFVFHPKTDLHYLVLEAQILDGLSFYYKGNIMLDGCSGLNKCKRADAN